MPPADPAQLVQQAQSGDRAALGELLRQQQDPLYRLALRMVSDPEDAADVTQQAMLKVVDQFDTFRGEAKLTTWMRRILINEAYSLLRKRRTRERRNHDPAGDDPEPEGGPPNPIQTLPDAREPGPAQRVQQQETATALQQALDQIDPGFSAILVLRDVDQMDYQQIAETLGVAVGTVKSRLFRARLALREALEAWGY